MRIFEKLCFFLLYRLEYRVHKLHDGTIAGRKEEKMLEIRDLSFQVEDGKEIIRHLDLVVEDNKFVVITGPNGGGKSTLAKLVAGIEKPETGKILFDGEDITEKSITERAKMGIGFAFQQPVKFKGIRVIDLLRLAAGQKPGTFVPSISMSEACEYLSQVGLCARDYIEREVDASLSGGELKRIEIATVMARKCRLTLFDEPEAGIDLWSFNNLIRIFEKMRDEIRDSSIIIISHQERILEIADEIVVVADGQIQKQGDSKTILPELLGTESAAVTCMGKRGDNE